MTASTSSDRIFTNGLESKPPDVLFGDAFVSHEGNILGTTSSLEKPNYGSDLTLI
ncbi:hypothetical protein [Phormidium sp. CCY1219]|uniref:hypothetical protein n=1 Tax=Phormidium sp. CCY1219 TaxID=2886104 RepID=UPI002D1F00EE|nr:hypothetical protein [Phormidium sp. CCY1219]MEB3826463.1 hypothetical protein [Phormidium sp. CCY1219]